MSKVLTPVRAFELVTLLNKALIVYNEPEVMVAMGVSKEDSDYGQALQSELNLLSAISDQESINRLCSKITDLAERVKAHHLKVKEVLEQKLIDVPTPKSLADVIWARQKTSVSLHHAGLLDGETSKKDTLAHAEQFLMMCEGAAKSNLMVERLSPEEIAAFEEARLAVLGLVAKAATYNALDFYNKLKEQELKTAGIVEKLVSKMGGMDDILEVAIQMSVDLLKPAPAEVRDRIYETLSSTIPPEALAEIRRRVLLTSF